MHGTLRLRPLVLQAKSWMGPKAGLNSLEKRGIFPFPENRTPVCAANSVMALITEIADRLLVIHIGSAVPAATALVVLYLAGGDFTDRPSRRDKKVEQRGRKQILQRLLTDPPS